MYNWEFIENEFARRSIGKKAMHDAGIDYDAAVKIMNRMLAPHPSTVAKLKRLLGCRQSDILTDVPVPPKANDEDDRSIRRCVVCGRLFMPYETTRRPDGSINVAGKDYCSFQCCEEENPSFRRKEKHRGNLDHYQGHRNNSNKKGSSNGNC